jgi:predicted CXXCH cytochrome family protein
MNNKRRVVLFLIYVFFAVLVFSHRSDAVPTHLDKSKMKRGCSTCHKSHGKRGTAMLESAKEDQCFKCHSPRGMHKDIYSVIIKPSSHPIIQTSRYHVSGELLPERDSSLPRHASCYDCHNVHRSESTNSVKGVRGYSGRGAKIKRLVSEYELCYNCHSDSANLSGQNISLDFIPSNASFHPVETYGKNSFVPSLIRGFTSSSLIKCSDCHGNDDPSGPKGPHGSVFAPILQSRYERNPGPESPSTYALCYQCHNRTSILNDESFKAHKVHIVFNQISCAQCHGNSHGSSLYSNLIDFDTTFATSNSSGEFSFSPSAGSGTPRCLLSCHIRGSNFDHKISMPSPTQPQLYCINTNCVQGW